MNPKVRAIGTVAASLSVLAMGWPRIADAQVADRQESDLAQAASPSFGAQRRSGQSWYAPTTNTIQPPSFQQPHMAPSTDLPPSFQITPSLRLEQSWTDNVFLTSKAPKPDFISTVTPSLTAVNRSRRFDWGLNYSGNFSHYAEYEDKDSLRNTGLTTLSSELIDQVLFLDSRASVSSQNVTQNGPISSLSSNTTGDQTEIITFSISPRIQQRLGDVALAALTLSHDETLNQSPTSLSSSNSGSTSKAASGLNNSSSNKAAVGLRNGSSFTQMLWDISAGISRTDQGNGNTLSMRNVQLGTEYRLSSYVGLLVSIGDEKNTGIQLNENKYSGPYYSGGIHYTPSPDTDLRMVVGQRYGQVTVFGQLDHKLGPRTSLRAQHEIGIITDAINAIDNLNSISRDETGNYVNPFSGQAADPSAQLFNRSNATFEQENSQLSLTRRGEIDTVALHVNYVTRKAISTGLSSTTPTTNSYTLGSSTTVLSADLSWSHRLTERTSANANMSINDTVAASQESAMTSRIGGGVGLSHVLSPTLNFDATYRLTQTHTPQAAATATDITSLKISQVGYIIENTVFLGISKRF